MHEPSRSVADRAEREARLARQVGLFRGLAREDIAKIFSRGMTMNVKKGDTVFYKGTVGNQMFVVLGGKLGVHDGKNRIAELKTGALFGEMALLDAAPRSATVTALEDSLLFVLNETVFQRLLTKRVAVRLLLNIVATLSQRLRTSNEQLGRRNSNE